VEKDVACQESKEHYKNARTMIIGRVANITEPLEGRTNCSTGINAGWDARLGHTSVHSHPLYLQP
jgi:hypothetical protein